MKPQIDYMTCVDMPVMNIEALKKDIVSELSQHRYDLRLGNEVKQETFALRKSLNDEIRTLDKILKTFYN